jgi:uncharacterized protein (DUF58 family)
MSNRSITIALKFYICAALVTAAIIADPVTTAASILVLLVFLFFQWRRTNSFIDLIVTYFMFFAIPVLLTPAINLGISTLISLPVLYLITASLRNTAGFVRKKDTRQTRMLTQTGILLPFIAIANFIIASFLGNLALLLTSTVATVYLGILIIISIRNVSGKSVEAEQIQERIVAGNTADVMINLHPKTKFGGILIVESPYAWLKIKSPQLSFEKEPMLLEMSLAPNLSGPAEVDVQVYAFDCWGLTQTRFKMTPLRLLVIPRARYAGWLAKRYLESTKPGMLPMISNVSTIKPLYGMRRGVEYYGSQLYQPGDELKSIDWKHSAKYNKMITKEFIEFHGQPAIMLVNLAAVDAEAADELAQKTIITALSLAREQIPTVIAAYDQNGLKLVTSTLQPVQTVVRALEITGHITVFENPARYLYGADITRLRANISRLAAVEGHESTGLAKLMAIEYQQLLNSISTHPATQAIFKAAGNANVQSTIVAISGLNHDANAIEVNRFMMVKKGNAFITI